MPEGGIRPALRRKGAIGSGESAGRTDRNACMTFYRKTEAIPEERMRNKMQKGFLQNHPILAMAQPAALPGSVRYGGALISEISERLLAEVDVLQRGGVDGVILQNFNDGPVKQGAAQEICAYLTRLACDLKRGFPSLVLGVLVCWDGPMSLAVAEAAQADFVRVEHVYCGAELTAAGVIEGQCVEVQQLRRKLGSGMPVYADVYEPHSVPLCPQPVETAACDAVWGGLADGLFLCGRDADESVALAGRVRARLPEVPLLCGGGSNADNVGRLLAAFDGVCVGQWIKNGSLRNPVDPARLGQYMDAVRRAREALARQEA